MSGGEQSYRYLDRVAFDSLEEGVVWQTSDGRVADANAAAPRILGLTRDELLGRTPRDPRWYAVREDGSPWPAEEHPPVRALQTGEPQRGVLMGVMTPAGGRRWLRLNSTPVPASSEAPAGVVTSFVDVTEEVELQRRLESTNRELSDLYEYAPCAYNMLDSQGHFLRLNETSVRWLGCSREEAIGRLGPFDFMPESSRQRFWDGFKRVLAGQMLEGVEIDIVGRNGEARHVRATVSPILDGRGRLVATRSIWHDITELHEHRRHLESVSVQQSSILDNDLVGIVRLRGRTIVWKNRAFDRILGYAEGELLGCDTSILYADEGAFKRLGEAAYPVLNEGGVFRCRLELRRKDASRVWVDCSGFMVDRADGEAIWFSRDITEERLAEKLRLQAAQLEAENRQLLETRRLQHEFLANMSHELRTPLNAVIGFAHLLRTGAAAPGSDKQHLYLEAIESGGRQLLWMIDSILTMADAERSRLTFHPEPVDPARAVEEALAILGPVAELRGVQLEGSVAPALGMLRIDPLRLRQILVAYIDNAVKFSSRGGRVRVRLSLASVDRFRIEVEDHGIGIRTEDLPALFAQFRQLSSGNTKAHGGLGVGLALVKLLVEGQGGTVSVSSQRGVGSTFAAELPRHIPERIDPAWTGDASTRGCEE